MKDKDLPQLTISNREEYVDGYSSYGTGENDKTLRRSYSWWMGYLNARLARFNLISGVNAGIGCEDSK